MISLRPAGASVRFLIEEICHGTYSIWCKSIISLGGRVPAGAEEAVVPATRDPFGVNSRKCQREKCSRFL